MVANARDGAGTILPVERRMNMTRVRTEKASYSTPANPGAVIESYKQSLTGAGWTVIASGGSGSSYGGGAGLQATNGKDDNCG